MDRARGRDDLGGDVRDAVAEVLERQLVEGDVGEATVGRHITGALMHLDHGIGRLVLGAEMQGKEGFFTMAVRPVAGSLHPDRAMHAQHTGWRAECQVRDG